MCDLAEVYEALEAIGALDGREAVMLVCSSQYPCPWDEANLSRITTLRSVFKMVTIGYSDHTNGLEASIAAAALGADVFEKHFAIDPEKTVDRGHALDPKGLSEWVIAIKKTRLMMGDGMVRPSVKELENKKKCQRIPGQQIRGAV